MLRFNLPLPRQMLGMVACNMRRTALRFVCALRPWYCLVVLLANQYQSGFQLGWGGQLAAHQIKTRVGNTLPTLQKSPPILANIVCAATNGLPSKAPSIAG
jgi:hypothetical protein